MNDLVGDPMIVPAVLALSAFAGLAIGSRWALALPPLWASVTAAATGAPAVEWLAVAAVSCVAVLCGLSLRGAVDQALD